MTAPHLQRIAVRMLYDPALVRDVYEDADRALAGIDLSAAERRWLVAADRRTWGADTLRRKRSLKALLDEFPVSSALVIAATRRLAALDAFFSAPSFHDCIQERRSLAMAYADYLITLRSDDRRVVAVVALERAMAQARRGRPRQASPEPLDRARRYRLASHVVPAMLPSGTLDVVHAVERVLFEISLAPVGALADDGPRLDDLPAVGEADELALTAERTGETDDVKVTETTPSLVSLLEFAREHRTGAELIDRALELGAEDSDVHDVLQSLIDDGLLGQ